MRAGRSAALAFALATAVIAGSAASAHRRDEFLQAARLSVEPTRVDLELDLTPGIAVAAATIADLDRDRDGALSDEEKRAYAGRVLDAVALELDGQPLHVQAIGASFPGLDDFRRGDGTIQLRSTAVLPHQDDGDHHLTFRNANHREGSAYLANALVPKSERVTITAQRRDAIQRELTIDYVLRRGLAASRPPWSLGGLLAVTVLAAWLMRPRTRRHVYGTHAT